MPPRASPLPLVVIVVGAVLYHLSSKSVPRGIHPLAAIVGAYVVAIAACLVAAWRWPAAEPLGPSLRQLNWAVAGIGVGAALIEVGFLVAYRAGWPLHATSLALNVAAAVLLIPIGVALFGERVTPARGLGVVLCIAGLLLVARE